MSIRLNTTTGDFLSHYAAATMKDAAESLIKKSVADFEKQISAAIWDEVQKVAVRYVKMMGNDPLTGETVHIEFHDSRGNPNRAS